MKILYHHRIASNDGQYVHIQEIVRVLKAQGHNVIMVGPTIRNVDETQGAGGGGWLSKIRQMLPGFTAELAEFGYSLIGFFKLCVAIKRHRPDAIYERYNLFYPPGIVAKRLFGLPLVLEVNSPLFNERGQYGGLTLLTLARWSEHWVWRNADHVLPVSDVLAGYIRRAGVPDARVTVIRNGIDPERFHPQLERHPLLNGAEKSTEGKTVVGFVGFCREWHHLDKVMTLIAKPENDHLFFLIVGDGPVADALNAQAQELGIESRYHLTGRVSRDEMPSWVSQIDIAIQPAVTPWASPLKMMEYLAVGTAIVASDSANIREILDDGYNALLFEEGNHEMMLAFIQRIAANPELMVRLQTQAAKAISQQGLTWQANGERIESIFHQLLTRESLQASDSSSSEQRLIQPENKQD